MSSALIALGSQRLTRAVRLSTALPPPALVRKGSNLTTVSVVLATITSDDWLRQAVHSVLKQEGVDLELILVLDGLSPDSVREYTNDSRVRLIAIPSRGGLANALSTGVEHSVGKYIARLDADDLCLQGRLQKQQRFLDSHPETALVSTGAILIDDTGERIGHTAGPPQVDLARKLMRRNAIAHSSVMMRRQSYDIAGGYDASLMQMEDYDLWLRMAQVGKVSNLGEALIAYRIHGDQMSRGASPNAVYTRRIAKGQFKLARSLGCSRIVSGIFASTWLAGQYARWLKVRRSGLSRYVDKS